MNLECVKQAYQAGNFAGSSCTAPLRAYNRWFHTKIQASNGSCQQLAWKVCHVATAIFAYLLLGLPTLVGVAINLCVIPPENGYSLWARVTEVPRRTEAFLSKLETFLSNAFKNMPDIDDSPKSNTPKPRYTYLKKQKFYFGICDIFGNRTERILMNSDGSQINQPIPTPELDPYHVLCISLIRNDILNLSQRYSWIPEKRSFISSHSPSIRPNDDTLNILPAHDIVVIPVPDHIPLPSYSKKILALNQNQNSLEPITDVYLAL